MFGGGEDAAYVFQELCRRMEYDNKEEYLAMIEKHGGIVLLIPHYANFEWITGMSSIMQEGDIPVQIYKPLHNKYMDAMFKRIRTRFGGLQCGQTFYGARDYKNVP